MTLALRSAFRAMFDPSLDSCPLNVTHSNEDTISPGVALERGRPRLCRRTLVRVPGTIIAMHVDLHTQDRHCCWRQSCNSRTHFLQSEIPVTSDGEVGSGGRLVGDQIVAIVKCLAVRASEGIKLEAAEGEIWIVFEAENAAYWPVWSRISGPEYWSEVGRVTWTKSYAALNLSGAKHAVAHHSGRFHRSQDVEGRHVQHDHLRGWSALNIYQKEDTCSPP